MRISSNGFQSFENVIVHNLLESTMVDGTVFYAHDHMNIICRNGILYFIFSSRFLDKLSKKTPCVIPDKSLLPYELSATRQYS